MEHIRWDKSGRTLTGDVPGQLAYTSFMGQDNIDLGGSYAPYVWDPVNKIIRYAQHQCQFFDWCQVIRDYATQEVLIDDQRFEVQHFRD